MPNLILQSENQIRQVDRHGLLAELTRGVVWRALGGRVVKGCENKSNKPLAGSHRAVSKHLIDAGIKDNNPLRSIQNSTRENRGIRISKSQVERPVPCSSAILFIAFGGW